MPYRQFIMIYLRYNLFFFEKKKEKEMIQLYNNFDRYIVDYARIEKASLPFLNVNISHYC